MLSFRVYTTWASEDSATLELQSKRCSYRVVIDASSVTIHGPGIETIYDREEDLPAFDSFEALAISAILQLEEG